MRGEDALETSKKEHQNIYLYSYEHTIRENIPLNLTYHLYCHCCIELKDIHDNSTQYNK